MPKFIYSALNRNNQRISGSIEAANEKNAKKDLEKQKLTILNLKHESKISVGSLANMNVGSQKVKLKDLVIFTRELSTMISAGVPLARSLAALKKQTTNKTFSEAISKIIKDVEAGSSFAEALDRHPKIFGPIYINMVRAGEEGGILDDILKKLAIQQEKDATIRGKFKSAMTYPIVLLGITVMAFVALMTFAVPKISTILGDVADGELPALTKALVGISGVMTDLWYLIIIAIVVGGFGFRKWVGSEKGRIQFEKLTLKVPVLKTVIIKVAVARFARIFASLLSAGVPVIKSLEITGSAIGNASLKNELDMAAKRVTNGEQLSETLEDSKYFPPIISQMIAVGEETGQTDEVLIKVADFYEEEVDQVIDSLSSIIEPVMILIIGVMVLVIAVGVIGPISSVSSQV